ncbi:hypothetical protein D9756_001133 [Leucocoprinus leucothites]|uniref:Glycoside hydrolase family 92 protein n=1 Tax=Leucocoprinus leucothites TaxID=201217 RepID=A0A8H5LP22_9AGAR|nr:hypothetical protein D9756_001133 [Leucoagaricus leucothites]
MLLLQALVPLAALIAPNHVLAQDRTPTGRLLPPPQFRVPASHAVDHVNLLIGNGGIAPSFTGGMIPSTGPPFAMTRWVAQTRVNYVSRTPYNITELTPTIHGFQATRQPAIWMGESASLALVPGIAPTGDPTEVKADFIQRRLTFVGGFEKRGGEVISPGYYSVELEDGFGGTILVEQSSTSRVGHLRFTFNLGQNATNATPYILIDAVRQSIQAHDPTNITFPVGTVSISQSTNEICGSSNERQDSIITPDSIKEPASHFKGFFCARFDIPLRGVNNTGLMANGSVLAGNMSTTGSMLSAFAMFQKASAVTRKNFTVNVKVGTSFISEDQARRNIDLEIPDAPKDPNNSAERHPGSLEATAQTVRGLWAEKLDRIQIKGASEEDLEIFYTAAAHGLTYPSEQFEEDHYYSAYDNQVHKGPSYTGYSIWDTYRAAWAWVILFAPERVPGMVTSMLNDFKEVSYYFDVCEVGYNGDPKGGWLPMWKNIVETNIMVGTHADSLIGEAFRKGITGFDRDLAWEAVWKDVTVAPVHDNNTVYGDRQENVDFEARAGLSTVYTTKGWVANDIHSESGSRTLDYAYDDFAVYVVAKAMEKPENITSFLFNRSQNAPFTLYNNETGFMEARKADGSWAGPDSGWTEGDKWIYSFDVVQNVPQLVQHRGGNASFVKSLEDHFNGGHNQHTNEPSHHIPYLYSLAGAALRTQERVRTIASSNYNNTPEGLSGNEDCGQMSAWYIFSAMGFYPVNPASGEYVVGSPFFDEMIIDWPQANANSHQSGSRLTIRSSGAPQKQYVKALTVNGEPVVAPVLLHEQIVQGGEIVFEMSDSVEEWGNEPDVIQGLVN